MKPIFIVTSFCLLAGSFSLAMAEKNKGRSTVNPAIPDASQNTENQLTDPSLTAKIIEAENRLKKTKTFFIDNKSLERVFEILNNQTPTNNQGQIDQEENAKEVTVSSNGVSGVKCIMNGNWAATGTGKDVGKSAAGWVDASGKSILSQAVAALAGNKDVARISVPTSIKSPIGGAPINGKKEIMFASSKYFGMDNSGRKFLCFVEVDG